ncbi:benzoate/H(+) symporter BenE family transporter [Niallia endozanthoxylica]|nr:benzoate/H(+) symporter BenE family transporter [Niallia endozanthoxylica]
MKLIPVPIVMGIIVGVMIRFTTEMITSITISPLLAGSAILVFLLSSRFLKKVPPVLSALVITVLLAFFTSEFKVVNIHDTVILLQLMVPVFNFDAIVSIGIPLALPLLCSENAQVTEY